MASNLSSLVVLLFCISSYLCKCKARSLGVLHKDMAENVQPLITKENDEKLSPSRVSTQPEEKRSIANATHEEESINEKGKMIIHSESILLDEAAIKHIQATTKYGSTKVSVTDKGESASYVSWRVPHKKRGEQEPGLNLDYLPPKTHPPIHN